MSETEKPQNVFDKIEEVKLEEAALQGLISLCDVRGTMPGITAADLSKLTDGFYREPTIDGYYIVKNRLRIIHSMLHELLYAPPGRN